MNYELREYSFGQTIGKGFNLYFNNFLPILIVSLISQIPVMALFKYMFMQNVLFNGVEPQNIFFILIIAMLNVIIEAFLSAYIIHLVSNKFLETNSLAKEKKSTSILPLIFPIIGLSILIGLICLVGTILLIIPGVIFGLALSIATPVLVIERQRIGQSIARSWELTKGKKWLLFGFYIVIGIISALLTKPIQMILPSIISNNEILTYLNLIVSALVSPIQSCILVVIYFNLRIEKEGFSIEHLAQQFALIEEQEQGSGLGLN